MKPKTVVVPLDGSMLAETALDEAVELGRDGASVVLLRAAEAPALSLDRVEAEVAAVREAEAYLEGVADRLRGAGITALETCVWYGPAAEAIVEAARAREADLIVMSSHGRSGLGRLVLGSVAESVLRSTVTPILLLRFDGAAVATVALGNGHPGVEVSHV